MTFLGHVITGLSLGSIYAIIALGYTMVYGIAKMLNFAHGDVIMVGAYICFFAVTSFNLPPVVGILLAMILCTILGIVIERLAYKPLRQAPSLAVLITAIGVSYFLQNGAQLLWGASPKSFPTDFFNFGGEKGLSLFGGRLTISFVAIVAVLACVIIMVALTFFTGKTKMGKAMRACSEDKGAAQLMGIN
ncbi:MAG: branched-chain amino acid ABC transporter permease, partial [Oscillospiraceae bacterium]